MPQVLEARGSGSSGEVEGNGGRRRKKPHRDTEKRITDENSDVSFLDLIRYDMRPSPKRKLEGETGPEKVVGKEEY